MQRMWWMISGEEILDKRIGYCAYNMSKNITALTYELNLGFGFGSLSFHNLIMKISNGTFVLLLGKVKLIGEHSHLVQSLGELRLEPHHVWSIDDSGGLLLDHLGVLGQGMAVLDVSVHGLESLLEMLVLTTEFGGLQLKSLLRFFCLGPVVDHLGENCGHGLVLINSCLFERFDVLLLLVLRGGRWFIAIERIISKTSADEQVA